jgi:hypothetical protein
MLEIIQIILIVIAGIIHILPLMGIHGPDMLKSLYNMEFSDVNLLILMKHRAILFGLLGFFMVYAAFDPYLQRLAIVAGLLSAASFILIAKTTGQYGPAIRKIIHGDWISIFSLLIAAFL